MRYVLLGLTHDLISKDDLDLAVGGFALDRFEPRFLRSRCIQPPDIALELAHQEQDPDDGERPHDEHGQQQGLIGSHREKCRV